MQEYLLDSKLVLAPTVTLNDEWWANGKRRHYYLQGNELRTDGMTAVEFVTCQPVAVAKECGKVRVLCDDARVRSFVHGEYKMLTMEVEDDGYSELTSFLIDRWKIPDFREIRV